MKFNGKKITISSGRVSSARQMGDETIFVVSVGGALQTKIMPASPNKFVLRQGKIVSYADECFLLDNGKLERRGELSYAQSN